MPRECAQCGERLHKDYFSTNQWRKGDGQSRCEDCVSQKSCPRDSDVAALVEYIVDKLKKSSTGMLAASELGQDIHQNHAWSSVIDNVGGLKLFCLDHADKIKWNPLGTGQVQLVKKGSIPIGAKVKITTKNPSYGWGVARSWSVGTVQSFTGTTYFIDFPEVKRWKGLDLWKGEERDLTICTGVDRSKMDIGSVDPDFNNFGFVRNKGFGKFEFSGAELKEGGRGLWEYGFVQASKKLTPSCSYFQMKIIKHRSDGIGIGLCGESFFAGNMVGWDDDSIGWHSDDGHFFYKTVETKDSIPLGPSSTDGDTLGCGVLFESESGKPKAVYFCRNEIVIGRFPLRSGDSETLFPVVSGGSPAIVQIDLKAPPPAISMACSLKTFEFEAKYNDSSKQYKGVTIKGPPNIKGEIPVNFKGYEDTVWIPQARLRKTEKSRVEEFSTLEQAFKVAADGDTIEVRDCGVHLMRDSIEVQTDITVRNCPIDLARKPTISLGGGCVFKTSAKVSLQNIFVKSVGGDASKSFTQGGAAAVVMQAGNLSIASCRLTSEKGSAVCLDTGKLEYFNIETSAIGPCGRNGLVLDHCAQESVVKDIEIKDCGLTGLASNGGDVDVTKCTIKNCETGLVHAGAHKRSATITVRDSSVTNCTHAVRSHSGIGDRTVILKDCAIDKCKIGVLSQGEKTKVSYDKNTSISNCNDEQKVVDGGKIVAEVTTPTTRTTPSSPDQEKIVAEVTTPLSVKQIKQILEAAGVNYSDCTEKNELEELLAKLRANPMGCARASGGGRDSSEQEKPESKLMSVSKFMNLNSAAAEFTPMAATTAPPTKAPATKAPSATAPSTTAAKQEQAGTTEREDVKSLVKEQSKDSSTVSVETTNFARYCRLLMEVGREVLMTLFKANYHKEEGAQWEESCGPSFVGAKFPDRSSQSNLGKHLIDSIRSGKCHEWDITLLSSLLIFTPGYIKGDASGKKAVEALRKERNDLAHDAHVLARLSLTEEQFQIKWEIVSAALKVLIQLLPGDKAAWRMKIDSIAKEEMGKSTLEPLFERVKEDMQRILDDLEDVRDKAGEAMRMAEGAARMSKVAAMGAEIEELKSLFNKKGHVDQDRLPRDVVLSNQKRYRLLKQVGKGGMGTVFEAKLIDTDSDDGKLALKICDADASGRAEREADILKQLSGLNHDNIVKFFDSAFEDSHLVIIMELVKGQSLEEWLEHRYSPGNSGVTFTETQPIVRQLVQGMSAVHERDIAHRDLKPANLVFDEVTGKLVIVDFGLSKQHNNNTTVTAANSQLGTFLYMSPEQFKGDVKEITCSSDVWAIGVVWHEMLTGLTPFEPASTQAHADSSAATKRQFSFWEFVDKVAEKGARKLPLLDARNVPSRIIGIIAKCLFFEKKDRYEDATDLFHQIEPVFQEEERARAEAAAREEEQQKEEERLRQEEEEKKRLEAEGRAQEEKRKRQEEAERRSLDVKMENISRFTREEMKNTWDAVAADWVPSAETMVCHYTDVKSAELIMQPSSRGFRASTVGQAGGGFYVVVVPPHEMGWEKYQGGAFRATVGRELWGEKASNVLLGGCDAHKLDVLFLIKMPRIWIEGGRGVPGRPAIRIIPLNFLYQHEDGFFYLQKQKIVKWYVLKGNPSSSPQDDVSSPEHVASGITTVSVHGKEAEEKAAAEVAAKREEERLAAEAAAAAEEADRKLREEQEPLRQEEERARAEAAAREEEQQKEEERLRQEEEEKKRLEAEGRAQEEKRKRQEEEAERRQMEEESADSDKPFKSRCASESVEPGWACSSSTCTTS